MKQAALSPLANCQVCRSEKKKIKNKEKQLLRYSYSVNDNAIFFQVKKLEFVIFSFVTFHIIFTFVKFYRIFIIVLTDVKM